MSMDLAFSPHDVFLWIVYFRCFAEFSLSYMPALRGVVCAFIMVNCTYAIPTPAPSRRR